MKTALYDSCPAANSGRSGLRPFAAVCAMALVACGTTACSGHVASQAPIAASQRSAPANYWPLGGSDPSLPAATQALKGHSFDGGEPAPTF